MAKTMGDWCNEAVRQVRFWPDRKRIWNELFAHLEDGYAELAGQGLTSLEMERRVLTAMGDPVEVGKQLDAIHNPWWGWLWKVTRWAVELLLFLAIVLGVPALADEYTNWAVDNVQEGWFGEEWRDNEDVAIYDLNAEGALEGYTFTVESVARCDWPEQNARLIQIKMEVCRPWYKPTLDSSVIYDFYLEDETGNRYGYDLEGYAGIERTLLLRRDYIYFLDPIPNDIPWLDLCYDNAGRRMTIRIDLTGGEGT